MRTTVLAALAACLLAAPACAQAPAASAPRLQAADRLLRSGKADDALRIYREVLQLDPASSAAQVGIARALLANDDVAASHTTAAAALAASPKYAPAHCVMAAVDFREGRFGPAESEYRAALALDSHLASAWLGLARVAEAVSFFKRAHQYVENAYRLAPDDPDVLAAWADAQPSRAQRIATLRHYLETSAAGHSDEEAASVRRRIDFLTSLGDLKLFELASPPARTQIPLLPMLEDPTHLRGWGVAVSINGAKPATFLLDTGAGGITIGSKLAARVGIKRLSTQELSGFGDKGPVSGYRGLAERVVIGGLEFRNCILDVSDSRSVASETGIIGTDVFQRFLLTLDLPSRSMLLVLQPPVDGPHDPEVTAAASGFTQFYRFGHMLLIPVRVNDGEPSLFLIDTGATLSSISDRLARQTTKVHADSDWSVHGLSGKVKDVYIADKIQLQFSHFRQSGYQMIGFDFTDMSRSIGTEVSGAFGVPLLGILRIVIDYRNGLIDFAYGPRPGSK